MSTFFLKSSAIIIIFYALYKLILQKETFFNHNRFFLISGLLFSIILPLIIVPIYVEMTPVITEGIISHHEVIDNTSQESFDYAIIGYGLYLTGILFFLGKFIINLTSLFKLIANGKKQKKGKYTYIITKKDISPFSFFNYIVFNPDNFKTSDLEQIITHEKIHATEYHSIDILISQLFTIVFWVNPFVWFYKKEIAQNLEFIADQNTQSQVACEKSYQKLLLKTSISKNQLALTNNFYNSLIKKRITMLHKNRSKSKNQWKYAIVLPIMTAFVFMFNTKIVAQTKTTKIETNVVEGRKTLFKINKNTTDSEIKKIKEELNKDEVTFELKKIKRNKKGEIVKISLSVNGENSNASYSMSDDEGIKPIIISSDGDNRDISINTSRTHNKESFIVKTGGGNIHIDADDDNLIVNGKSKKGFVYKYIDRENEDGEEERIIISGVARDNADEVLYVLDGKKISIDEFKDLKASKIKQVNVLKGEKAVKKYGEKAKDGVIEITTKK